MSKLTDRIKVLADNFSTGVQAVMTEAVAAEGVAAAALDEERAKSAALQKTIDSLLASPPAPDPGPPLISPDGDTAPPLAKLYTLEGEWSWGRMVDDRGTALLLNGQETGNVGVEMFMLGGTIWHKNSGTPVWCGYRKDGKWSYSADPRPAPVTTPDPTPAPATGGFWANVLRRHGFNSDLGRAWNDAELEGFAKSASAMRSFGFARPAPYSAFKDDSQNINQIERAIEAGLPVLYSPFTVTKYDADHPTFIFPAISDTAAVTRMRDRAVDIAGTFKQRGLPEDMICFELGNEPLNTAGMASTFAVYQVLVNAIREVHPDLYLAAMGNGLEGKNGWELYYKGWLRTGPLNDPRKGENRISHGHHHYDPMRFTHQGCNYSEGGVPIPKQSVHYPLSGYGKAQMRAAMKEFADWGKGAGVQIHVGEMMATFNAPSLGERLSYVGDFFDVAREFEIPTFAWCDDNSANATVGGGWFSIMKGTKGAATFTPEWDALIATAG